MNLSTFTRLATTAMALYALPLVIPCASQSATAQQPSIGIVDKAQVANASKAWKAFQKKLDGDVKLWQKKASEYEAELQKQGQSLVSSKDSLSPSQLREKQLALQKRGQQLNNEIGKEKQLLDQRVRKAERTLNKAIDEASVVVGRKRGLPLVLNAAMVIHSDQSLDLTKEVAVRVNKTLKKMSGN